MANSGSMTTNASQERSLTFDWWVNSQSTSGNYTNIGWNLIGSGKQYASNGYNYYVMCGPISVSINGTNVYYDSTRVKVFAQDIVATGSTTIYHDSAGNGTISASVEAAIYSGSVNCYASNSWSLPTIARNPSTITATNATVGGKSTITISKANSSFTHTLRYTLGSSSGTIVSKTSSSSYSWTIPTSFNSLITGKSATVTIYCDTYSGSTMVGTKQTTITVSIDEASKPTLNPTVEDSNSATIALTGNKNKLVRYCSNAKFAFNDSATSGATITSRSLNNGSNSSTDATGTIYNTDSGIFTFSTTDSRGFTTTVNLEKEMVNYVYLTCNAYPKININGSALLTISGNYFNDTFGSVNNTLTVKYRFKEVDGSYPSTWTTVSASPGANNTYSTTVALSGFDYRKTYVFQALAQDKLAQVTSAQVNATGTPVFDWGMNDFNFNVPVRFSAGILGVDSVMGDNRSDWVVEEGQYTVSGVTWDYRLWNSGIGECWGRKTISTAVSTAWGSLYVSGAIGATAVDYPFDFVEPPSVNVTLIRGTSGAFLIASGSGGTASTNYNSGGFEIARGISQSTAANYTLNYQIKGRWK